MSVLRALGTEPSEPDSEQREWFQRGHLFEKYVVDQIAAKHGRENVRRNVVIRHPLGEGHADALIVPDRLLVEVKSTQQGTLSTPVFENGVAQLRFYLRFCDEADEGALYMVNPSTLKPADVYPVRLTDDDVAEIDATVARIEEAIRAEELLPRVCTKPSQGRGYFCPFITQCFEGWEEPQPEVVTDPVVLDAAARFYALKEKEREHKQALAAIEEEKRGAKAALAYHLPERGDTVVGGFRVKTWPVDGKTTVSAKALAAAGIDPAPFARKSDGYQSVKVTKATTPGDVDFGETPF